MTPCASISFCRQACRLDAGQSVADLRKKWCCVGTQNLMHSAYCFRLFYGSGRTSGFFPHSEFFPGRQGFLLSVFFPQSILGNALNKVWCIVSYYCKLWFRCFSFLLFVYGCGTLSFCRQLSQVAWSP